MQFGSHVVVTVVKVAAEDWIKSLAQELHVQQVRPKKKKQFKSYKLESGSQSLSPSPAAIPPGPAISFLSFFLKLFFFGLFRATLAAYASSQARGQIGATAASLCHSHSNMESEPRLRPTLNLCSLHCTSRQCQILTH